MSQARIGNFTIQYTNRKEYLCLKKEIFTEEIYKPESGRGVEVIFDIGSYIGLSSLYFAKLFPDALVVSIEPNPQVFEILMQNCSQLPNIEAVNKAVMRNSGLIDYYLSSPEDSWFSNSGVYPNSWTGIEPSEMIQVGAISFNELLMKYTGKKIVKIDIEGYEKSILKGEPYLEEVVEIFIEYHPQEDNGYKKISKILRKEGFDLVYEINGLKVRLPEQGELFVIHGKKLK